VPTKVTMPDEIVAGGNFEITIDWVNRGVGRAMRDFRLQVALVDGKGVGYAFFFPNFASFRGQRGFYLEDIYIAESYRGKGVGEAMLRELARLAASRGYERIDFVVLDWNTSAIEFYKKLGAEMDRSERHFKFTDDAFRSLAS